MALHTKRNLHDKVRCICTGIDNTCSPACAHIYPHEQQRGCKRSDGKMFFCPECEELPNTAVEVMSILGDDSLL